MPKFRKKPIEIDAICWTGENIEEILNFMEPLDKLPNPGGFVSPGVGHVPALGTLDIPTLEGIMVASPGDWIIKGVEGEFYPCKPSIFEASYERTYND